MFFFLILSIQYIEEFSALDIVSYCPPFYDTFFARDNLSGISLGKIPIFDPRYNSIQRNPSALELAF